MGHEATYIGNENGLVVQYIDRRGGLHQTEYNEYNEVLSETDPLGNATTYAYDERGNRVQTVWADGASLQVQFDDKDRPAGATDAVGGKWQWRYDVEGNVLESVDPLGNITLYTYNRGLLRSLIDTGQQVTNFQYDAAGNLLEVRTPDGQQRRRLYDGWGQPLKVTDAQGNVQWFEYDLLSRLIKLYEPDGNVRQFSYDALDNLIRSIDRYQNALAERVNGILKDEFLFLLPDDLAQARLLVRQAVHLYNEERPHLALHYRTPNHVHQPAKSPAGKSERGPGLITVNV